MASEIYFTIVERLMSIEELLAESYVPGMAPTREQFLVANPGLESLGQDYLWPSQMVNFPVPFCPANEREFYAAAGEEALRWNRRIIDAPHTLPPPEILKKYYDTLSLAAQYGSAGAGAISASIGNNLTTIEALMRELEKLYVDTYNTHGNLNTRGFFQARQAIYFRLDQAMNKILLSKITGVSSHLTMRKTLGLSSKSIVHQWKHVGASPSAIPGFSTHISRVSALAKTMKRLGYVGIALDGYYSSLAINKACDHWTDDPSPLCRGTQYGEGGRLAGSVLGGMGGGAVATYVVCNLLIGVQTLGTSFGWCALVAGGAGAVGGGMGGDMGGEWIGDKIYDSRSSNR